MGGKDQNYKTKNRYKTITSYIGWYYITIVGETNFLKDIELSFHFCHFTNILGTKSKVQSE